MQGHGVLLVCLGAAVITAWKNEMSAWARLTLVALCSWRQCLRQVVVAGSNEVELAIDEIYDGSSLA